MPNITGNTHWIGAVLNNNNTSYANGVFSAFDTNNGAYAGGGGYGNAAGRLNFDASRSSSVYGSSSTVQPKATEMYLYFYVGNFTQTALENTAGVTTEVLNTKVTVGHEVIEFQEPTSSNNYTWYRKYADGWVEQGGRIPGNVGGTYNVSMPVEMADTNYNFIGTGYKDSNDNGFVAACIDTSNMSTTGFRVYTRYAINGVTGSPSQGGQWQVSGMAAS